MEQNELDFNPETKVEMTELIFQKDGCQMSATILGSVEDIRDQIQKGVDITILRIDKGVRL